MPLSGFSKEILDYARACEHLIGESIRHYNHFSFFSEDELHMVNYYADEGPPEIHESKATGRNGTVQPFPI